MTDTLGAELILIGPDFPERQFANGVEALARGVFPFGDQPDGNPCGGHAAYRAGLKPLLGEYRAPDLKRTRS